MYVLQSDDYAAMSRTAAALIAAVMTANPKSVFTAATGNTPMGTYKELAKLVKRREISATNLSLFQLDEYLGIERDDPRTLYRWMNESLIRPLGIPKTQVWRLPSDTANPEESCRRYAREAVRVGGFDLAVLGLGPNGHLGFNEPPSAEAAPTRAVSLSEQSIESNGEYWGGRDRVPRRAITAGLDILLGTKQIVLLVSGEHKAEILRRVIEGPVNPEVPASYLREAPNVTILADKPACKLLVRK